MPPKVSSHAAAERIQHVRQTPRRTKPRSRLAPPPALHGIVGLFSHTTSLSRIPNSRLRSDRLILLGRKPIRMKPMDHPPAKPTTQPAPPPTAAEPTTDAKSTGCPCRSRLLPRRRRTDRIQRQRHLNQLPLVAHPLTVMTVIVPAIACDTPVSRSPPRRRSPGTPTQGVLDYMPVRCRSQRHGPPGTCSRPPDLVAHKLAGIKVTA